MWLHTGLDNSLLWGTVLCIVRWFISILGFHPLAASSTIPLTPVTTKNVSRHFRRHWGRGRDHSWPRPTEIESWKTGCKPGSAAKWPLDIQDKLSGLFFGFSLLSGKKGVEQDDAWGSSSFSVLHRGKNSKCFPWSGFYTQPKKVVRH